jgi:hypothetical protein
MSDKPRDQFDRAVKRTATQISSALDKMTRELPDSLSPQLALECVVAELAVMQPWYMRLIMEDTDIRESYAAAVAKIPAKPPRR